MMIILAREIQAVSRVALLYQAVLTPFGRLGAALLVASRGVINNSHVELITIIVAHMKI